MDPPSSENQSTDPNSPIGKLTRGLELAAELKILLGKTVGDDGLEAAAALAERIMQSLVDTLSMLNSAETYCRALDSSRTGGDGVAKKSDGRVKIPTAKDRSRGYKKRRTSSPHTVISATPFEDGYGWRKYGQKEILGAKYPRSYFRCTHKNDQDCQATKQVQQIENDPSNYLVTYMGHHTCKDTSRTPQLLLDTICAEPFSLSFESNAFKKQDQASSIPSVKQEFHEILPRDFPQYNSSPSSSTDYYFSPFDSYEVEANFPLMAPEKGGNMSGISSPDTESLDMDMKMQPVVDEDLLIFDGIMDI